MQLFKIKILKTQEFSESVDNFSETIRSYLGIQHQVNRNGIPCLSLNGRGSFLAIVDLISRMDHIIL
jgi:hypothetical protein